ncbi:uncharacterized protein LOC133391099 [Anopheles gambiae]|uniref:uncharacterized protein LOC133391099 n=1 Tax=Anopheles gambiae TaxID=7165 RepID=UPI002AC9C305|nr:uncharacterized protein LOC133391099 [Anopheles gambiae]
MLKALMAEKQRNRFLEAQIEATQKRPSHKNGWFEEDSDAQSLEPLPCFTSTTREVTPNPHGELSTMTAMSFATLQMSSCIPNPGEEEIDSSTFQRWKGQFEAAMDFAGISDETMKMNAFKMKAESKLLDMLLMTPSDSSLKDGKEFPYSNAIERLEKYYCSHDYVFFQRQKLRSLVQNKNESDSSYVKRVIECAKICNYKKDQLLETVVDVTSTHATNAKVRAIGRKVLRKSGSLVDFLDRVRACEIESINEETFAIKHQPNKIGEIAAVSYGSRPIDSYRKRYQHSNSYRRSYSTRQPSSSWNKGGSSQHTTDRFSSNRRERCWRCSGNYHLPEDCHAANKRCHNCQVVGHIERACRLIPQHLTKRRATETTEPAQTTKIRKIAAISDNNCLDGSEHEEGATNFNTQPEKHKSNELTDLESNKIKDRSVLINTMVQKEYDECCVVGYVAGMPINFLIDSGADVNTIDKTNFDCLIGSNLQRNLLYSKKNRHR